MSVFCVLTKKTIRKNLRQPCSFVEETKHNQGEALYRLDPLDYNSSEATRSLFKSMYSKLQDYELFKSMKVIDGLKAFENEHIVQDQVKSRPAARASRSNSIIESKKINTSLSFNDCVVKMDYCDRKRVSEVENPNSSVVSSTKNEQMKKLKRVPFTEKTNSIDI